MKCRTGGNGHPKQELVVFKDIYDALEPTPSTLTEQEQCLGWGPVSSYPHASGLFVRKSARLRRQLDLIDPGIVIS